MTEYLLIALALLGVLILGALGLVVPRLRRRPEPPLPETEVRTRTEEELAGPPVEATEDGVLVEPPPVVEVPSVIEVPPVEVPEPTAGRLVRLRSRLSRSQNVLGKSLLSLLTREHLDEDVWEEIEDSLITADVGIEPTQEIVARLRERTRVLGTRTATDLRTLLAAELVEALDPSLDRSLRTAPKDGRPAVLMVVGVNGAGKTTTCGKIARVLVADGRSVVLGAADTFRAAAADQLETWASRVGAETVRGPEAADPASVAFDAVRRGIDTGVDTVLIDTAGRLQNKVGLMDELGKVKRVVEKHGPIDETLLVLDATTGQNGLEQARVFTEVVNVTGVVLTKLDGTAKGGIVIAVQRRLGIPVKLVGLGEGKDDLAPFDPVQFVDALLGTEPLARDA
ncbi:signal recognition particle-docking protein FtsY [Micromonospora olivasterospora]|uniref:Signal recognition particle receptor FtsY n=1 Tax=Micromonospora olivasterospora TaxID=1880 RepID=A0A562ID57_MICOL|nr:signal recognition particle-docking protein FtsY [Micromonospora olivasterospora]TWH68832.1 signal recognition particle-docking protein FtsY [Micromonospora olivasterospora]